jgi:redox-sensitive bicupin YhaK (pirin superfamily)
MGWGNLRVINEDRIAPGTGFGTHGHRDMEIISYVLEGKLAHKDTLGNVKGIPPGDVQRMSAGTRRAHSEFNHAPNEQTTHFLQIWIEPDVTGIAPSYEQKTIPEADKRAHCALWPRQAARPDSVTIHADARIYAGLFDGTEAAVLPIDPARKAYVFVARGSVAGQRPGAGHRRCGPFVCRKPDHPERRPAGRSSRVRPGPLTALRFVSFSTSTHSKESPCPTRSKTP